MVQNKLYFPSLDSLRGLLALCIFVYHARLGILKGGFIAVDIFFALSGFLITLNLLKEWETTSEIDYWHFQKQRQKRLWPAYACLLFVWWALEYSLTAVSWTSVLSTSGLYMMNWYRAYQLNHPLDLGHTWSLSIEAQFYLLFPALLIALIKLSHYFKKSTESFLIYGCTGLVIASWSQRLYLFWQYFDARQAMLARIYNGLDTCLDTLSLGAIAACLFHFKKVNTSKKMLILCATSLIISLFWLRHHTKFYLSLGHNVIAILSSLLILCLAQQTNSNFLRPFEAPWLKKLGLWSYSFYLWHYPIINWLYRTQLPKPYIVVISLLLSLGVAKLSYEWIEKRFWTPFKSRT